MVYTFRRLGYLGMALAMCVQHSLTEIRTPRPPLRAAFFYGYPSLINGAAGNIQVAAKSFSGYDIIVLGDGVEFSTTSGRRRPAGVGRVEYDLSKQIISLLMERKPQTEIFGYVCLGDSQRLPQTSIKRRIEMWKALGVSGIFLDEAGYDWRIVTRQRQNYAIRLIHSLGLTAFLNAFDPTTLSTVEEDRKKNPTKEPSALNPHDLVLLESFPIKHGEYLTPSEIRQRLDKALDLRRQFSTRIVALSTMRAGQPFQNELLNYACRSATTLNLDAFAWGEPNFSADNKLPQRSCDFYK